MTKTIRTSDGSNPSLRKRISQIMKVTPHWLTVLSALVLAAVVLAAIFAPFLTVHDPVQMVPAQRLKGPSPEHLLGTDAMGRDLWARIVYGARTSLFIGLCATLGAVLIGVPLGLISGYFRRVDSILMRLMDGVMAIPSILLAVALIALFRPSLLTVIIAIAIPEIPQVARLVRAKVLSTREEQYVEAALLMGTRGVNMLTRHLLPSTIGPIMVQVTYVFAAAILIEAGLSFLGVGISAETPTWGNIMADGRLYFTISPYIVYWPALALTLTILSINIVGDALRERLDPVEGTRRSDQ